MKALNLFRPNDMEPILPTTLQIGDDRIYASFNGGVYWFMIRAINRDTFISKALELGLMVYTNPNQDAILDEEGNVIQEAVEASGDIIPARNITITEIGKMVLTKGQYDDDFNEIVAPTYDERWHVNVWVPSELADQLDLMAWAVEWTRNGVVSDPVKEEESVLYEGIELIDPATVSSPSNQLL